MFGQTAGISGTKISSSSNQVSNDKIIPVEQNSNNVQKKIVKVVDFEKNEKTQNGKKIKIKTF